LLAENDALVFRDDALASKFAKALAGVTQA